MPSTLHASTAVNHDKRRMKVINGHGRSAAQEKWPAALRDYYDGTEQALA
jgi:hypothetical protein